MKYYLFLILILMGSLCYAQNDRKLAKINGWKKSAQDNYSNGEYEKAIEDWYKIIKIDSTYLDAYYNISDLYYFLNDKENSLKILEQNVFSNGQYFSESIYMLAKRYFLWGEYTDAKEAVELYLSNKSINGSRREKGEKFLKNCEFAIDQINNPVEFDPINLGENINSKYDEFLPSLTIDEDVLLFIVTRPITRMGKEEFQDDFFLSFRNGNEWTKAKPFDEINTPLSEGAQSFSADGSLLFFCAYGRKDGKGNFDIYYSYKSGKSWSTPRNIGKSINTYFRESEPSISSDGKTLYFVSDRPGGFGGKDIWKSTLTEKGYWRQPVNLGDSINTANDEYSPFIHPDNQTLYFSSNGHMGMGGYDLFVARKNEYGWSKPKNIGYPINTSKDEINIFINSSGKTAYYSSRAESGFGNSDLYYFEMPEKVRPHMVAYAKGIVFDAETNQKLEARFELINLKTGETVIQSYSDPEDGSFLVCLPQDNDYALNVSKEGYLFFSENFNFEGTHTQKEPYKKDIALIPVKTGKKVVLKNVFFDTDSYELKPESKVELNKLAGFLNSNPTVRIQLNGHTDNVGSESDNLVLSDNRAKAVVEYLIKNGIPASRLQAKGFGESKPIDNNDTEKGRANNRRTEFEIISK
ncbi:MAG: hypothetical protein C0594_07205 [Marinilabiliales bacterium]|nr:MAG: hypothetical protein C0594_07205 [Marinilabiliales bacterium]